MKKVIYGFDILKFFMAMMVALGHLKGLVDLPSVEKFFLPFMGAAVPTFFVISSFLIYIMLSSEIIYYSQLDGYVIKSVLTRLYQKVKEPVNLCRCHSSNHTKNKAY